MVRVNVAQRPAVSIPIHEPGATQTFRPAEELRRIVSCCLLGEKQFYVDGADITDRIRQLASEVLPSMVAEIAVEARRDLGLRHVPLVLMLALAAAKAGPTVQEAAQTILRTPRDAMDLVALYWANGKRPLPWSFREAIRKQFAVWTDYQLAKYATLDNKVSVRLRDLEFLTHPHPRVRGVIFKAMADDELRAPDTWESALSVPGADKSAVWTRLLSENKLGALALVRNLRNMEHAGVKPEIVRSALAQAKANDVWPWQALAAAREAPAYTHDLDALMTRSAGNLPRIPGKTGVLVDTSPSMRQGMSARGTMMRSDAACGLASVLREVCDDVVIAAFSSLTGVLTGPLPRGAMLAQAIDKAVPSNGTMLGQAVADLTRHVPDLTRLVVITDEQSQDRANYNACSGRSFIVNLASSQRGIAWEGPVTRIHGWSGGVVRYLAHETVGAIVAARVEDEEGE